MNVQEIDDILPAIKRLVIFAQSVNKWLHEQLSMTQSGNRPSFSVDDLIL